MILLVDDDSSVTASLALLLRQAGHATRRAASPDEALRVLEAERVDLVLQDMNFSRATTGEEGLALLERVRRLDPGIPVILLTAWASIALAVEGMKRGASDFVAKPWSNAHLLQTVETALALARDRAASVDLAL